MENLLTYCYWGELSQNIQIEYENIICEIPIINTQITRNQIIVLIDTCFNKDFYDVFGYEEVAFSHKIEKKVENLKIVHIKENIGKTVFKERIYIEEIYVVSYIENAEYNLGNALSHETHRTIFIHLNTRDKIKKKEITTLHHCFNFFDEFGIVILNKNKALEYIDKENLSTNLLNEIESSNLSEILADKGLMTILWGFTPWYYKIIVTTELGFQLPVGIKVYETGRARLNGANQIQSIYSGNIFENIECIKEEEALIFFNNGNFTNYLIKFYVAGGASGISEFEGLKVFIHIELSDKDNPIFEFDQVDPLSEFNRLFHNNYIGNGISFSL